MKKKKLLTMAVSLALVAVVGVGATLAYMSSQTDELKNTFTVGSGIDADLQENVANDGEVPTLVEEGGYDYNDIQPGDVLTKAPFMTITKDSADCYAFLLISGVDALETKDFTVSGFDAANWVKVCDITVAADGTYVKGDTVSTSKDGVYRYVGPKATGDDKYLAKNADNLALEEIFTTITYDQNVDEVQQDLSDIYVVGCAVQYKNLTPEQALVEAIFN